MAGMTTAETWAKRVEEWQASGETSTAYCAGKDFTPGGLRHWAHRLRARGSKSPDAGSRPAVKLARVVAVRHRAEAARRAESSGVAIDVGTATIRVCPGFDRATLAAVVAVLRSEARK